jgi:hypothetical protein
MRKTGLALLLLAACASIAAGLRYLLATEFMPYHAIVTGKAWSQVDPGTQTIVLGMLKIVGGGFLSCGVALLWLFVPLRRDEAWARWAALSIAAAVWLPTQYVTFMLKSAAPVAQPPIIPTAAILVLVLAAVGALFAARTTSPDARQLGGTQ